MEKVIHHKFRYVLIFSILLLLAFLARLPSLAEPFDNDSSANAYHARLILRGETLYGSHHPAHHMPAVYYTYALAFALFGESDFSVKLLLIPWTALTACLIFKLGARLKGNTVGLLSAVFFIMLTAQYKMKGTTAELELFANLPIVWGTSLALQFSERRELLSRLFCAGIMFGIVLAYKASLILFASSIGILMVVLLWQEIHTSGDWRHPLKDFIQRSLVFLSGFLAVTILILSFFVWEGVLDRFFMIFTLGQGYLAYSSSLPAYRIPLIPLIILGYNNAALLVFGLVGLLRLFYGLRRENSVPLPYSMLYVTWLLVALLITGITRIGYVHYALVAVPPLALIAAWEITNVSAQVVENLKLKGRIQIAPLVTILSIVIAFSLVFNYQSPYHYLRYRLGMDKFDEYLSKGTFEGPALVNSLNVAKYLLQNTIPKDYIYNWSDSPQIYFYSDRRSPIETIWPYYALSFGGYNRIFIPQTKYIILGHSIYVEVPDWMRIELAQAYQLETVIGEYELYRRKAP